MTEKYTVHSVRDIKIAYHVVKDGLDKAVTDYVVYLEHQVNKAELAKKDAKP